MNKRKKYTVEIFSDHYLLASDDSEENVLQVSSMIDDLMRDIANKSGNRDHKKIAILAALQVGSLLLKAESLHNDINTTHHRLIELVESAL